MATNQERQQSGKWIILMSALIALVVIGAAAALYYQYKHPHKLGSPQQLEPVQSVENVADQYDVIVVGTDPEGVTAAVSAARNGLKTLLVDGRDRDILGGLFTIGWLNTLDMNWAPGTNALGGKTPLNKGLFSEWFAKVEGDSFDVTTAANAFYDMVKKEPNIDLHLHAKSISPIMKAGGGKAGNDLIEGVEIAMADGTKRVVHAKAIIDATQDADIAAAAGVPFTYGRGDLGDPDTKMAVTLVLRLKNVTPEVWAKVKERLNGDDNAGTGANEVSAWGYSEMYKYKSSDPKNVEMRGLNIGRQNNGTMLINAMQIYGIDGTDPKSLDKAFEIGRKEAPLVVDYMKKTFPEFATLELDATASELYVRETRHIEGEYRLNILDVLENHDHWDRIAFGSYEVDIQRSYAGDGGAVVAQSDMYAVPFRSIVPKKVDGLLVVGRSASFDTLPHGSARTVPVGMATGEAAGAAAKIAKEASVSFRELSASKELVTRLQEQLNAQGMDIKPFSIAPYEFMKHPQYEGLKVAVSYGLAYGSYKNANFAPKEIDAKSNPARFANLLGGAKKMKPDAFKGDAKTAIEGGFDASKSKPLTLDQASEMIAVALGLKSPTTDVLIDLKGSGYLTESSLGTIKDKANLTNGDTYMLLKDIKDKLLNQ